MASDVPKQIDPEEAISPIVAGPTSRALSRMDELEAAWTAWSDQFQEVHDHEIDLFRAAFDAGWEAGEKAAGECPKP
jgi:hypothetical protein